MDYSSCFAKDERAKIYTLMQGISFNALQVDTDQIYRLSGMKEFLPEVEIKSINKFYHTIRNCRSAAKAFFQWPRGGEVFAYELIFGSNHKSIETLDELLQFIRQFYYDDCIKKMIRHFCNSFSDEFLEFVSTPDLFPMFLKGLGIPEVNKQAMLRLMNSFDQGIRDLEDMLIKLYQIVEDMYEENKELLAKKQQEIQSYIENNGISDLLAIIYPRDCARGRSLQLRSITFMPTLFFPFSFSYGSWEGKLMMTFGVHRKEYLASMEKYFPIKRVVQVMLDPYAVAICGVIGKREKTLEDICFFTGLSPKVVESYLRSLIHWGCVLKIKRKKILYYQINYMFQRKVMRLLPEVRKKKEMVQGREGGIKDEKLESAKRRNNHKR